MWYKVDLQNYQEIINNINTSWKLSTGQERNFLEPIIIQSFGYIEKNNFVDTQTFDYIEIVSELPPVHQWHDEGCSIQIIQTISDCLKMLRVYPAMAQYKLDNNIEDVEEFGFIYFYVNELFQQHREILMDISGEGRWTSIINEK